MNILVYIVLDAWYCVLQWMLVDMSFQGISYVFSRCVSYDMDASCALSGSPVIIVGIKPFISKLLFMHFTYRKSSKNSKT